VKRLLLGSTSATYGTGYLDHLEAEIRELYGAARRVLFVPYALRDRDLYAARARERLGRMGLSVEAIHESKDPTRAVLDAEAFFIGGGNTFRLLREIHENGLVDPIRMRVEAGIPYLGTSAGSNVACVTIKTTNDMPIVEPPTLRALGLVPFNINPHYVDADPASTHMGETRETRIREFHEENDPAVVGLREGSMLRIEGLRVRLAGTAGARVFFKGRQPREFLPGADLDFLLET